MKRCRKCPTFGEWHFEHANEPDVLVDVFDRAALVRAILAEQWVAAIALYNPRGNNKGVTVDHVDHKDFAGEWMGLAAEDLAALPCAVDVVAERIGER